MLFGYNTNGFSEHKFHDIVVILREIGYQSVAVTLDHRLLDPPDRSGVRAAVAQIRPVIHAAGMRCTVESGARYVLDPRHKHQPTLISGSAEARSRRAEYLKAAVEVAAECHADSVSLWSGAGDDNADFDTWFGRLCAGLDDLLVFAEQRGVRLAFEPEPGMFIDTMDKFARLHGALKSPFFGLTLDVGHVHCLGDGRVDDHVAQWRNCLWNVHLSDMRRGRHEHLMFGEGSMDVHGVIHSLSVAGYQGPIHLELPRHSHDAVNIARKALEYLLCRHLRM